MVTYNYNGRTTATVDCDGFDSDGNVCQGKGNMDCFIEDPGDDECVMNIWRHRCLKYEKKFIGGICKFVAMLCSQDGKNLLMLPAVYGALKFECSYTWKIVSGVTLEAGGYLKIGFGIYNPASPIRLGITTYGWSGNVYPPLAPSSIDDCNNPQPSFYIEGAVWIHFKFSLFGINCFIKGKITIRLDIGRQEVEHKFELSGGCGSISFGIEVGLVWDVKKYAKFLPKSAEFGVSASLVIDECVRLCHPWGSCGWRGCRSWEVCHRGCVKLKLTTKLGPWSLKLPGA
jgi:hypothetical protein